MKHCTKRASHLFGCEALSKRRVRPEEYGKGLDVAASGDDDVLTRLRIEAILIFTLAVGNGEGDEVAARKLASLFALLAVELDFLSHGTLADRILTTKAAGEGLEEDLLFEEVGDVASLEIAQDVRCDRGEAHGEDDERLVAQVLVTVNQSLDTIDLVVMQATAIDDDGIAGHSKEVRLLRRLDVVVELLGKVFSIALREAGARRVDDDSVFGHKASLSKRE